MNFMLCRGNRFRCYFVIKSFNINHIDLLFYAVYVQMPCLHNHHDLTYFANIAQICFNQILRLNSHPYELRYCFDKRIVIFRISFRRLA